MTEIGMTRFRSRGIGMTRMTKNRRPSGGIYTINGFRTFSAVRRPEENFEFYSLSPLVSGRFWDLKTWRLQKFGGLESVSLLRERDDNDRDDRD